MRREYSLEKGVRAVWFKTPMCLCLSTGTEAPGVGLHEERVQPREGSESCVVYNPYVSLSIDRY